MSVCVVSAFYRIPSKHSVESYLKWMDLFFKATPCKLVLFTEPALVGLFSQMREAWPDRTMIIGWPFQEFTALKRWGAQVWMDAKAMDKEAGHSPELYCMWYEKKEFVLRAIALKAFAAEKFVWCDAGILRFENWLPPVVAHFPLDQRIEAGKITVLQVVDFKDDDGVDTDFAGVNRIGGGIQAGDAEAWTWWSGAYDAMLAKYLASGRFVGKDQSLIAACVLQTTERFVRVRPPEQLDGYSKWFWLLLWLSGLSG